MASFDCRSLHGGVHGKDLHPCHCTDPWWVVKTDTRYEGWIKSWDAIAFPLSKLPKNCYELLHHLLVYSHRGFPVIALDDDAADRTMAPLTVTARYGKGCKAHTCYVRFACRLCQFQTEQLYPASPTEGERKEAIRMLRVFFEPLMKELACRFPITWPTNMGCPLPEFQGSAAGLPITMRLNSAVAASPTEPAQEHHHHTQLVAARTSRDLCERFAESRRAAEFQGSAAQPSLDSWSTYEWETHLWMHNGATGEWFFKATGTHEVPHITLGGKEAPLQHDDTESTAQGSSALDNFSDTASTTSSASTNSAPTTAPGGRPTVCGNPPPFAGMCTHRIYAASMWGLKPMPAVEEEC